MRVAASFTIQSGAFASVPDETSTVEHWRERLSHW